jgi:hypothetical protein
VTVIWDDAWTRLSAAYTWLAGEVVRVNPKVHFTSLRTAGATFVFGAYVSFSRLGVPGEEDLVVSVNCKREGEGLRLTSDIATGDGMILAEGPRANIGEVAAELMGWVALVDDFVRSHRALVCDQLKSIDPAV